MSVESALVNRIEAILATYFDSSEEDGVVDVTADQALWWINEAMAEYHGAKELEKRLTEYGLINNIIK